MYARTPNFRRLLHSVSGSPKRNWSSITPAKTGVTVHALNNTTFPYIWLRDSCQSSPECIDPSTRQKVHRTSDIPLDIKPISFGTEGISVADEGLKIAWTDGHRSVFSRAFLERHSTAEGLHKFHKDVKEIPWNNASVQKSDLFLSYGELQTPKGLVQAITQLSRCGLLFVTGVPIEETSDETCEVKKLSELFGEIRPTFYGSLWDVVTHRNSKNIAYTNLDLGLHMDLMYFQHPPRFQVLHCLRNRVLGGTSIFVDGLTAAETLRNNHPEHFQVLTTSPVAFHYINDGHHLHYEHPTIELAPHLSNNGPSSLEKRRISYISYSPPFQAPLPIHTPLGFYPALRRFSEALNDPANTYRYDLREGDAVLFDNRRVLHARTAFSERGDDVQEVERGEMNRWLKGCYFEADTVMDRARAMKAKIDQGLI